MQLIGSYKYTIIDKTYRTGDNETRKHSITSDVTKYINRKVATYSKKLF